MNARVKFEDEIIVQINGKDIIKTIYSEDSIPFIIKGLTYVADKVELPSPLYVKKGQTAEETLERLKIAQTINYLLEKTHPSLSKYTPLSNEDYYTEQAKDANAFDPLKASIEWTDLIQEQLGLEPLLLLGLIVHVKSENDLTSSPH